MVIILYLNHFLMIKHRQEHVKEFIQSIKKKTFFVLSNI
jgi:hypothetical protein